jgi:trimeric autotransporter adhesin
MNRTDLWGTAREMIIKEGICLVGAVVEIVTKDAISAAYDHSLALRSNGTVVAWGSNGQGQCNVPLDLSNVTAIVAGCYASLALKRDGTVVFWGGNGYGQQNVPPGLSNVIAIAGYAHFLALRQDGTVVAWGAGMTNNI